MTKTTPDKAALPHYLPLAAAVMLFAVAYYPALELFYHKWSGSEDYTHAFFSVPIVLYMIWQQRRFLLEPAGQPAIGFLLVLLCLTLYLFSLQLQVPTVIFGATVLTVVSVLIWFGGFAVLRYLAIPILLLFMVIPIPNQLLSMVTAALQLKVSQLSELVLNLFAIPLYREGNILQIPGKTFQVVDACSGIRSLISLTTLSLIIGYFLLKRPVSLGMLFIFALPIAILINILRVVSLVLAYHYFGLDLGAGTAHTATGLVLFCLGLALLFGFERVLEKWENAKTAS